MAVQIVMPKLGMAMTEGEVVKWLKEDGAQVAKDEPVVQVMSKKITYEVKAPQAGVLRQAVLPKQKVPVGAVIGYITAPGEEVPVTPAAPAAAAGPTAQAEALATPMAKRLAREHGIDLREVRGTGPGGRIQESDVLAYLEQRRQAPAAPEAPPAARVIPFTGMRRAIAERMTESLQTMAQVTITTEADVTGLVEFVDRLKTRADISYTAVLVKAVAAALKQHPILNSTLVGDEIRLLDEINIGVGVALDEGLIVPVIRNADRLSLAEIDRELKRLAAAARAGTLTVDEVTGSTFTISNLGMYGVDAFTPIINPPEVAILGVGRITEKPAVYRGQVAVRSLMTLSLTFDHRVVDGAPAAAFLQTLAGMLAQPALIFGGEV
ncbi:MAG: 2-oxo acid dehydrogenase subunit E2 [Chloroflexota bacterium]